MTIFLTIHLSVGKMGIVATGGFMPTKCHAVSLAIAKFLVIMKSRAACDSHYSVNPPKLLNFRKL